MGVVALLFLLLGFFVVIPVVRHGINASTGGFTYEADGCSGRFAHDFYRHGDQGAGVKQAEGEGKENDESHGSLRIAEVIQTG